jgi:hypothetical protein
MLPAEPIPEHELVVGRRRTIRRIAGRALIELARPLAFVALCWLAALFAAAELAVGWMYRIPDDPLAPAPAPSETPRAARTDPVPSRTV